VEINSILSSRNEEVLRAHEKAIEEDSADPLLDVIEKIYRYLKRAATDLDVLIVHNVLTMHYNLPLTYALHRLAEEEVIPIINWSHDSPFFYDTYPDFLKKRPFQILKKYNPKMQHVVISNYRKKLFYDLYGEGDFFVVPNGVDPSGFFGLDYTTMKLVDEQQLFKADLVMVQPTRLHPRKNIELSIKVLKSLKEKGVKARLLITGAHDPHETRDREYLESLLLLSKKLGVEEDVLFLAGYKFEDGEILTPDKIVVRDLLLIADILFMPSYHEGFGIPLLEAGMIKVPVICSDIPPFKEIGEDKVCIFSLKESPDEIANKIISFVSGSKVQRFFREVIKNYTWDNIYERRIEPLLEEVIGRKLK